MKKSLIVFDLYNTIIIDDAVEEQHTYRMNTMWSTLEKSGFPIKFAQVIDAYQEAQKIMKEHQKNHFSLSIFELVNIFANKIKLTDITLLKKFYEVWSFASLQYPPHLIEHVKEGLENLKQEGLKIALISNTSMTPGIALRFLLKEKGVYDLFDDMVFSDEFGFMKPENMIFHRVLDNLSVKASNTLFVGDHEFYDKHGATSVGMDYMYMSPQVDFREIVKKILQ